MAKQILVVSAVIALIMVMPSTPLADVPQLLSFQGKLYDNAGNPLTGQYEIIFRILDVEDGGTPLWSETINVDCEDGLYTVNLGAKNPITLDCDGHYWLGIQVAGNVELSPRYRVISVPVTHQGAVDDSAVESEETDSIVASSGQRKLKIVSDVLDEDNLSVTLIDEGEFPDIEVSATSHDYGYVAVGDSSLWTLTVFNVGTVNLILYGIISYRQDFSVLSPNFPWVVAPAGSLKVTVAFVPTLGAQITGNLSIESNDPDEPLLEIDLTGNGIAGDLHVLANDHDYGNVVVGDSALWVVPLYNIGRAPLTVHQVITESDNFRVVTPTFPQTIEPGQNLAVSILFTPSILGSVEKGVTVTSTDLFEPSVILTLRGNGLPMPLLQVVDGFGDPGSSGNKVFIDLHNSLEIAAVEFSLIYDSDLLTITDALLAERAEQMGIFNVSFQQANQIVMLIQDLSGEVISSGSGSIIELTLRVSADASMGQLALNLIGVILYDATGSSVPVTTEDGFFTITVPDIVVPVHNHNFGRVSVGRSTNWTCRIYNAGTKDLVISGVPTGHTDFQVTEPTFPYTVAAAESVVVTFTFAPSALGLFSVSATIESNDPDQGVFTVSLSGEGIKPDICIAEVIHNFGEVLVDTSLTWEAPITNLGRGELVIDTIFTIGSDFSVEELVYPQILMRRENLIVAVMFTPSLAQAIRGSLVVVSNDADEERFVLPLWGRGITQDIDLSTIMYDFGEVNVGESEEETFLIYNRGRVELVIDSVKIQPSPFTVFGLDLPKIIAPGGSLSVTVAFAPTFIGEVAGSLTVFSNDPDEWEISLALLGLGVAPDIDLSATSYIFGWVKLGQSEEWDFSISNVGTRNLVVESIFPDTSDFVVTLPIFPQTIEPGEDLTVLVAFLPSAVGMISGRLTVFSNDPDEAVLYITLMGHGAIPDIELSTTSLDFGLVAIGATSERKLTVHNVGDADLVLSDVSSNRDDFLLPEFTFPVTVPKRDSLEVVVTFTPLALGVAQGSLSVVSDDTDEPAIYVDLEGKGIPQATLKVGKGHGIPSSDDNPVFIYLDNTVPVATIRFLLNFDPEWLSISNVQTTSAIAHMGSFDWDVPRPGELLVLISDFGSNVIEPGTGFLSILRVDWSVSPDAELGSIPLTLDAVALYDGDENEVITGIENGFFIVGTSYVYNFGDVPLRKPSSLTVNYSLPDHRDHDVVIGGIECDNPDFTIASPCHSPLVVSASEYGKLRMTITFTPSQTGEEWGLITLRIITPKKETLLLPVVGKGVKETMENWTTDFTFLNNNTPLAEKQRRKEFTFEDDPEGVAVPQNFAISQNYPNPFNPETTITFDLPEQANVRLKVYNILGQTVDILVEDDLSAGKHTIKWDGGNAVSGVYFYRLEANDFTSTKRMMLMK